MGNRFPTFGNVSDLSFVEDKLCSIERSKTDCSKKLCNITEEWGSQILQK